MARKASSPTRREVLKKGAYLAPLIVTLPVLPSFASSGSRTGGGGHDGGGDDGHGDGQGGGRGKRRRRSRGSWHW